MLEVENLSVSYGDIQVLFGLSLQVKEAEVVTLIGSNGAGKSTLLMTICGEVRATSGKILYNGKDISKSVSYKIMKQGIAQVPEGRRIFPKMTVLENLQMGSIHRESSEYQGNLDRVFHIFPLLKERAAQSGGTLSGGEQQMLAIARALMGKPELLLLDEPSLGLAPMIVKQIFDIIREINETGTTILLVEQNAFAALKLANRACVLSTGEVVMTGDSKKLLADKEIQNAYLGG